MTPPSSSSSPPSEGEIVESDSEKATTAIDSNKGNRVDRPFRTRASVSRSPSPTTPSADYKTRTDSRSPYRDVRGSKRSFDDDHYDRTRNDPRRFKVRYEDSRHDSRSRIHSSYHHLDRFDGPDRSLRSEDHGANRASRGKLSRNRSRSPGRRSQRVEHQQHLVRGRNNYGARNQGREQGDRRNTESRRKLSREQSVSDRGHSPVAAAQLKHDAETQSDQTQHTHGSTEGRIKTRAEYVQRSL